MRREVGGLSGETRHEGDDAVGDATVRQSEDTLPDEPGLLDEIADRMGFRDRLRANRTARVVYRVVVACIGVAIIVVGVVLLPLPGPGWLVIFVGLGVLSTEFAWAERLLDRVRAEVRRWTQWIGQQAVAVRLLVSVAGLCLVLGVIVGTVRLTGAPDWVPDWVPLIR